jgi:hypothetical protein
MNPECWQTVGELFEQALALPAGEQTVWVERASANDDELQREVLSLLASHKALPGGFVQEKIQSSLASFYQANLSQPSSIGVAWGRCSSRNATMASTAAKSL